MEPSNPYSYAMRAISSIEGSYGLYCQLKCAHFNSDFYYMTLIVMCPVQVLIIFAQQRTKLCEGLSINPTTRYMI